MTELERLQKEINGKVVKWVNKSNPEIYIDAILLWPPGGEQISVKPYGIDVEVYYMLLHHNEKHEYWSLDELSQPSDCLSSHKELTSKHKLPMLRKIAAIKDEGVYIFEDVIPDTGGGNPSCPYG
jgi:hypothetical protein